jgi:hypothetical protein
MINKKSKRFLRELGLHVLKSVVAALAVYLLSPLIVYIFKVWGE